MRGLMVAKVIYYLLVFCWLMQISFHGYTRELIIPTVVLILYGIWLNYKMRQTKNK